MRDLTQRIVKNSSISSKRLYASLLFEPPCSASILQKPVAQAIQLKTWELVITSNLLGGNMDILSFLINHKHYWGVPHKRKSDGHLIQICYDCGSEREVKVDLISFPLLTDSDLIQDVIKAA